MKEVKAENTRKRKAKLNKNKFEFLSLFLSLPSIQLKGLQAENNKFRDG